MRPGAGADAQRPSNLRSRVIEVSEKKHAQADAGWMPTLSRELWRALLRSARRYDVEPAYRSLLAAPRTVEHDLTSGEWTAIERPPLDALSSADELAQRVTERAVAALCGGGRLYVPGRTHCGGPAYSSGGIADGATSLDVAATLVQALRAAAREALASSAPRLHADAAFSLLRRLEAPIRVADRVLGPPVRARATCSRSSPSLRLFDGLAALRRGSVLLSHPLMRRDVVLLLEADGPDGYAFGLVTNQPTASPLGAGPLSSPGTGVKSAATWTTGRRMLRDDLAPLRRTREDDLAIFGQSAVFYGGPDGGWNLTMLHPHAQVRGSVRVRDGLHYGGDLAHAASMVREGKASAADFCFYRGRVDWQPGQLRGECRLGEWVVAQWDDTGGGSSWPPPGLMPRLARYAASAADLQLSESITDLGTGAGGRLRSYKLAAWAHVVAAVADGAAAHEAGEGAAHVARVTEHSHRLPAQPSDGGPPSHPLRAWLRFHALEASELEALQGARKPDRRLGAPPAWRTQEDWGVSEKWPGEA